MVARADAPVLIVDDNADTRDVLRHVLAIKGFPTATAADGQAALDYLRGGGDASLIILDLRMPGMDGHAFRAAQLADPLLADIPVIIFTASPETDLPNPAPLLRKGTDPGILLALVGAARRTH
jgi:CheY-like chemotaxis protein